MTERKAIEIKRLDGEGTGVAKIATLSAIDREGDTYASGAFGEQEVKVLSGHAWDGPPIGKGRIFEQGDEALAEFKLNLDIPSGQAWHKALQFDLANGKALQEWSFGFQVIDAADETRDGSSVRVLKELDVFEVSPVVLGAGVDTGTLSVKSRRDFLANVKAVIADADRLAQERETEGKQLRPAWVSELETLKTRIDGLIAAPDGGQETRNQEAADRELARFMAITTGQR